MIRRIACGAGLVLLIVSLLIAGDGASLQHDFQPDEAVETISLSLSIGDDGEPLDESISLDLGLGFPLWLDPVGRGEVESARFGATPSHTSLVDGAIAPGESSTFTFDANRDSAGTDRLHMSSQLLEGVRVSDIARIGFCSEGQHDWTLQGYELTVNGKLFHRQTDNASRVQDEQARAQIRLNELSANIQPLMEEWESLRAVAKVGLSSDGERERLSDVDEVLSPMLRQQNRLERQLAGSFPWYVEADFHSPWRGADTVQDMSITLTTATHTGADTSNYVYYRTGGRKYLLSSPASPLAVGPQTIRLDLLAGPLGIADLRGHSLGMLGHLGETNDAPDRWHPEHLLVEIDRRVIYDSEENAVDRSSLQAIRVIPPVHVDAAGQFRSNVPSPRETFVWSSGHAMGLDLVHGGPLELPSEGDIEFPLAETDGDADFDAALSEDDSSFAQELTEDVGDGIDDPASAYDEPFDDPAGEDWADESWEDEEWEDDSWDEEAWGDETSAEESWGDESWEEESWGDETLSDESWEGDAWDDGGFDGEDPWIQPDSDCPLFPGEEPLPWDAEPDGEWSEEEWSDDEWDGGEWSDEDDLADEDWEEDPWESPDAWDDIEEGEYDDEAWDDEEELAPDPFGDPVQIHEVRVESLGGMVADIPLKVQWEVSGNPDDIQRFAVALMPARLDVPQLIIGPPLAFSWVDDPLAREVVLNEFLREPIVENRPVVFVAPLVVAIPTEGAVGLQHAQFGSARPWRQGQALELVRWTAVEDGMSPTDGASGAIWEDIPSSIPERARVFRIGHTSVQDGVIVDEASPVKNFVVYPGLNTQGVSMTFALSPDSVQEGTAMVTHLGFLDGITPECHVRYRTIAGWAHGGAGMAEDWNDWQELASEEDMGRAPLAAIVTPVTVAKTDEAQTFRAGIEIEVIGADLYHPLVVVSPRAMVLE